MGKSELKLEDYLGIILIILFLSSIFLGELIFFKSLNVDETANKICTEKLNMISKNDCYTVGKEIWICNLRINEDDLNAK